MPKLCADGVALGRMEGDILRTLVDERARRRGEPADECSHCLYLLCASRHHLVDDVHHLAHDGIHGLAALLEDVSDRVVRSRWVVVGLVVSDVYPSPRGHGKLPGVPIYQIGPRADSPQILKEGATIATIAPVRRQLAKRGFLYFANFTFDGGAEAVVSLQRLSPPGLVRLLAPSPTGPWCD
eukprot:2904322-Pleurochrysis_carterae.AAC.2